MKYYKDCYCVTSGIIHRDYRSFDSFEEAWEYFAQLKNMGWKNIRLFDVSERTSAHPAIEVYRKNTMPIRIA